ncbi:hypothetical protein TorRG33x02_042540 [Trema orientale]|uniref:Uncharacterized protein n=1 Tax=Trema orientale TaxID=63057 RepID=A0A2P5FPZ3_TREOI|nr:hypothetical protein TorRG33x02_042540 [Trema orientale]
MRDMNQMKRDMDDRYVIIISMLSGIQEKLGCNAYPIRSFPILQDYDDQVADNWAKTVVVEADIHTNDYAKRTEEDEPEIDDQDNAVANDSVRDTKVNENEKKDNDGGDSKVATFFIFIATDSNAKGYTEDKDTDGENHPEIIVNKDKGSDVGQCDGGKLDVIDDQEQVDMIDQGLTDCFLDNLDQKIIDETKETQWWLLNYLRKR